MEIIRKRKKKEKRENNREELCEYCFLANCPFEVSEFFITPKAQKTALDQRMVKEALFIVEGELDAIEIGKGKKQEALLKEGDFVIFDSDSHNLLNNQSGKRAKILSFIFLGDKKIRKVFT